MMEKSVFHEDRYAYIPDTLKVLLKCIADFDKEARIFLQV